MPDADFVLRSLMAVIEDRVGRRPPRSYTTQLLNGGVDLIGSKIFEEAKELVEAAVDPDCRARQQAVTHEAADLIYHVLVLLGYSGVSLDDVEAELRGRFGKSGLVEKSDRPQQSRKD
jgi:phosphoribosyl-ATP pyrophosphohydrolase